MKTAITAAAIALLLATGCADETPSDAQLIRFCDDLCFPCAGGDGWECVGQCRTDFADCELGLFEDAEACVGEAATCSETWNCGEVLAAGCWH